MRHRLEFPMVTGADHRACALALLPLAQPVLSRAVHHQRGGDATNSVFRQAQSPRPQRPKSNRNKRVIGSPFLDLAPMQCWPGHTATAAENPLGHLCPAHRTPSVSSEVACRAGLTVAIVRACCVPRRHFSGSFHLSSASPSEHALRQFSSLLLFDKLGGEDPRRTGCIGTACASWAFQWHDERLFFASVSK